MNDSCNIRCHNLVPRRAVADVARHDLKQITGLRVFLMKFVKLFLIKNLVDNGDGC